MTNETKLFRPGSLPAFQNWLRVIRRDTKHRIYKKEVNFIAYIVMAHYRVSVFAVALSYTNALKKRFLVY